MLAPLTVTLTAAIALVPFAAAQSVYVPGDAENAPGASISEIGVGPDGFTSYLVNGVTIAADATNVIATELGPPGAVVYSCAIGADAQATCSVSQVYDGATYGYTEPVSYFGNAAAATPTPPDAAAATSSPATPSSVVVAAAASTSTSSSIASTSQPTSAAAATAAASSSSSQNNNAGPQANQPQPTSSNVFGANSAASKTSTGSIVAGCAGAMALLAYFAL